MKKTIFLMMLVVFVFANLGVCGFGSPESCSSHCIISCADGCFTKTPAHRYDIITSFIRTGYFNKETLPDQRLYVCRIEHPPKLSS